MLESLIEYYEEGNKTRFAKRLGLSPQGISTWLSRGTMDHELLYAKCERINADWLLSGEGSMLRDSKITEGSTMGHSIEKTQSTSSDAVTLRLMDKLDEKEAKIDQLQSELRIKSEELAALKANHQHSHGYHEKPDIEGPHKVLSQ